MQSYTCSRNKIQKQGVGWHIPGGIIRFKETFEERLQKTAYTELGTYVKYDKQPLKITEVFMPYQRRGHFISFLYRCYLDKEYEIKNEVNEYEQVFLKWHSQMPENLVKGQTCYYEFLKEQFNKMQRAETK